MKHGLRVGAFALVAFLGAGALDVHKEKAVSQPAPVVEAVEGPRCTVAYPRGFAVAQGTKKRPLKLCKGDLQSTWRGCHTRYAT